ncbi:MAG TPA: GNAT family N-acetyltransferase [Spongiibacteraceae bacterium]|nr:GNAT family N-acetyltransferase [Spongiibacteraceae bacterium]
MNSLPTIRLMETADFPSILAIQALCYTELVPESEQSLRAKLHASPTTCHVACMREDVIGYLIAVPWSFENPPLLNAATCDLPAQPDSLYLHDMAIAPAARKVGAGGKLVERFIAQIAELNFNCASLVAVQDSKVYWQRYGFQPVPQTATLKAKLASYGANVEYMRRLSRGAHHSI